MFFIRRVIQEAYVCLHQFIYFQKQIFLNPIEYLCFIRFIIDVSMKMQFPPSRPKTKIEVMIEVTLSRFDINMQLKYWLKAKQWCRSIICEIILEQWTIIA